MANKELVSYKYLALDCGFAFSWIMFLCMDIICKRWGARASVKVSVFALLVNLAVCLSFAILSRMLVAVDAVEAFQIPLAVTLGRILVHLRVFVHGGVDAGDGVFIGNLVIYEVVTRAVRCVPCGTLGAHLADFGLPILRRMFFDCPSREAFSVGTLFSDFSVFVDLHWLLG